jgi:hypothetical protein
MFQHAQPFDLRLKTYSTGYSILIELPIPNLNRHPRHKPSDPTQEADASYGSFGSPPGEAYTTRALACACP